MTSTTNQPRLYHNLSWIWPIISPPEEYVDEAAEFITQINNHSNFLVKNILDLGCGAGHNDFTLKQYFSVTGVDLSPSMLAMARELNPECNYLLGDMRTIRLGKTFDSVIIADSIDYMLSTDDLRAAFKTAFIHLKPGGVFCTYAEETKDIFQQNKTKTSTFSREETTITSIENTFDPDLDDTTYEFTCVYLIRTELSLSIEHDYHIMGIFDLSTWIDLIEEAGFNVNIVQYEDAGPLFICQKPAI